MHVEKDHKLWEALKVQLQGKKNLPYFHERELWICHLGSNIGYEQDGKGAEFVRPVLIFRKFNSTLFLGMPLTSTAKMDRHYFTFRFDGRQSTVILSQVRVFDARRLKRKMGDMQADEFRKLQHKCRGLFLS